MKRALILEDELSLADALELSMKELGYEVEQCTTIASAKRRIEESEKDYDLILLDRRLPDGDSISLCRELRDAGTGSLILMLTASGETKDKVEGLKAGADDYLPKPFSWEELEARVSALERRGSGITEAPASLWQVDEKKERVLGPKGWVELTSIEFKLLTRLMKSPGEAQSKKQLLQDVWGLKILTKTRTVDWFIGRLRKHFEEDPQNPKHIQNLRGRGYFFEP